MRVVAVLANKEHPELGAISIPIPIRTGEYSSVMKMLSALGIGDITARDCQIEELTRACPTLRKLEGTEVNIDELDYLAKRLDGFDTVEITQFQAMADKLNLTEMKDLINLTFSCQQATVITDFSDLEAVGRNHYMNTHGGSASVEELEHLDGEETAILLIEGNKEPSLVTVWSTTTGCSSHSSMMGETCPAIIMKATSSLSAWHPGQNQRTPQTSPGFISPQPTNKLSALCTAQALTIQKIYLFGWVIAFSRWKLMLLWILGMRISTSSMTWQNV